MTNKAFAVFSEPQYRWLFASNGAFFFAMTGQMLTRSILAWDLTGRATAIAYISLAVAIPMLIASLVGGAITDRIERRKIIIFGQSIIVAAELSMLFLLLLNRLQFWHMLCVGFISGSAFPFIMPARMAITVSVVGSNRIQSAMAFSAGLVNLSRVAGPAVMGVIIAHYSIIAAYAVASVLYMLAIACMYGVKTNYSSAVRAQKGTLVSDIWQGLVYVYFNRPLLVCLLFGLLPLLVAMPFQNLLVMLVEQAWQKEESAVGTLISIGGIGGVLGSIWVVRRGETHDRLMFMVILTLAFATLLGLFAQTPDYYLAMALLLIANTCVSAAQTVNSSLIQILADNELRGRVSSLMMMSFSLMPIGVYPLALAADRFGAANAITGACMVLCILIILFMLISPTLRKLDHVIKSRL